MTAARFRIDREAARAWLTGALVLAALIWAISWLLDTQQIGSQAMEDEAAAVAAATTTAPVGPVSSIAPVPLSDLLPLGPEDDGFRVTIRGTVVAEPISTGFWVLTDEDEVIFVQSTRSASSGEELVLTGTLRQRPNAEGEARAAEARLREAAGWKVHRALFLDADPTRAGDAANRMTGEERDGA